MGDRGQGTVEWLALVTLVALLLAGAGAAAGPALGPPRPAAGLAAVLAGLPPASRAGGGPRARAARIPPSPPAGAMTGAYGAVGAALVRRVAPGLVYERRMRDHPVDPRSCRSRACAEGPGPVTLFTHVLRDRGRTYVQFWAYYPDSAWNGIAGRHADDWESFQVRVEPGGSVMARASAHHGYTGRRIGADLNLNQVDPGWVPYPLRAAWTPTTGWLRVARSSHAGYLTTGPHGRRFTLAAAVRLVPLETARALPQRYAIVPPWRKRVWGVPEWPGT